MSTTGWSACPPGNSWTEERKFGVKVGHVSRWAPVQEHWTAHYDGNVIGRYPTKEEARQAVERAAEYARERRETDQGNQARRTPPARPAGPSVPFRKDHE